MTGSAGAPHNQRMAKTKTAECPTCGGPAHDVVLPKRNGVCKTCGGRIHRYPASSGFPEAWAHVNSNDWLNNPHKAEPKGQ